MDHSSIQAPQKAKSNFPPHPFAVTKLKSLKIQQSSISFLGAVYVLCGSPILNTGGILVTCHKQAETLPSARHRIAYQHISHPLLICLLIYLWKHDFLT